MAAHRFAPLLLGILSATVISCDSATAPDRPGMPASMQIVSGDQQEGVVGERLPEPLVVQVLDDEGNPVAGQIVNWVVTAGGGSVFAGAALTNSDGLAFEYWTIGTKTSEENVLEVRAVDPETREPIVYARFTARGRAGAPVGISRFSNVPSQSTAGQIVSPAPSVLVRDAYFNHVEGVEVTFEVVSGGGTASPATVTTNAEGQASTTWTLGFQVGQQTLRASMASGASVEFHTNASLGSSASGLLIIMQQPSDSAGSYEVFAQQPIVRLIDQSGAPVRVAGVPVSVVLAPMPSSGILEGTRTVLTDADGIARFTDLLIRSFGGSRFKLNFFRQGTSQVVTSREIVVWPWDYTLEKLAGDNQTSARGSTIEVKVRLIDDATGEPVAGRTAASWVKSGNGTATQSVVTDENGIATFQWTLGPNAGLNELQIGVIDVVPVVFRATGQ